ncbi:MAG: hypothetical protein U0R79_03250 [Propionicimonas sp.]
MLARTTTVVAAILALPPARAGAVATATGPAQPSVTATSPASSLATVRSAASPDFDGDGLLTSPSAWASRWRGSTSATVPDDDLTAPDRRRLSYGFGQSLLAA